MIDVHFSSAIRGAVSAWMQATPPQDCLAALEDPVSLGERLLPDITTSLANAQLTRYDVQREAWKNPMMHLRAAFDVHDLPETPTAFFPVPDNVATIAARACAVACLATIRTDTVSYGSENDGHLFVNLVVLPGKSESADKSKKDMRGHTDGVSFPIRGQLHEIDERVAPSPDFVLLAGLRNPNETPTTVMSLDTALAWMTPEDVRELTKPQYIIRPQKTFLAGLIKLFGKNSDLVKPMEGVQLLFEGDGGYWIRYNHSAAGADFDSEHADGVLDRFSEACSKSSSPAVIEPGDILLVNNRVGLHGRGEVGGEAGGTSRWLLRTYGLDTQNLTADQRYPGSPFRLFP